LQAIFKTRADKLPAYVGFVSPDTGYVIYGINAVKAASPNTEDPEVRKLLAHYDRSVTEEELNAWMTTLREKFPVEIKKLTLEKR
jgi:hypothetical protein